MRLALLSLLLMACPSASPTPAVDALEAFALTPSGSAVVDEWASITETGPLSLTGADRDLLLDLGTTLTLTLHTPTRVDLSFLDGQEITAVVSEAGLHEERSVILSDADGAAYFADDGWHRMDGEALFGDGFVDWGSVLSTTRDSEYDWSYTTAVFATDDGLVELQPGVTQTLRFDGVNWRVGVIAAYTVEPRPMAALPCGGISDMLSYEMTRVPTPGDLETVLRPAELDMAHLGCL